MRPILAFLITVGLLGGIWSYIEFAASVRRPPAEFNIDYAQGEYSIDIARTFECSGDPIFESAALTVLFKGETVFTQTESIAKDEPVVVKNLQGVEVGENEIFVTANMLQPTDGLGAIKITIKRNDISIAEKLLTSVPGLTEVSGPVSFTVGDKTYPDHEH